VKREEVKSLWIPDKANIFTSELVALNLALDILVVCQQAIKLLYSQTLSCVLAIQNLQAQSGYVMKFLKLYSSALMNTGERILCWVPGHIGIGGNEQADNEAKMALHSSISAVKYPVIYILS